MSKVLFISYHFPPHGTPGALRIVRFAKHLQPLGWIPYVLTVKYSSFPYIDYQLLRDLPNEIRVFRTFSFEFFDGINVTFPRNNIDFWDRRGIALPKRIFRKLLQTIEIPDDKLDWVPFAFLKALQIIRDQKIDLIFTTGSPFSTHIVGLFLKKVTNIPWVADFRDPWTLNPYKEYRWKTRKRLEEVLEKKVLSSADLNICITELQKRLFLEKYTNIDSKKFQTVSNGFDPDEFKAAPKRSKPVQPGKFKITYTGTFYTRRTPKYFLLALKKLFDKNESLRACIKVTFVGELGFDATENKHNFDHIRELGLENEVILPGLVSHRESLRYILDSDLLLLIGGDMEQDGIFAPIKLFEYMAAGKPILALVEPGVVSEIVEKARIGRWVPGRDTNKIVETLEEIIGLLQQGNLQLERNWNYIEQFNCSNLTKQLAEEFKKLIKD